MDRTGVSPLRGFLAGGGSRSELGSMGGGVCDGLVAGWSANGDPGGVTCCCSGGTSSATWGGGGSIQRIPHVKAQNYTCMCINWS